jgi:5-methylcytosine-specific restriction endonuclease McrA
MNLVRISAALRRQVRERASERCEYCLLAELKAFFPHEPDHIIAQKHAGQSALDNLALACFDCNRFKGSDIASVDPESGVITPNCDTPFEVNSRRRPNSGPKISHDKTSGVRQFLASGGSQISSLALVLP